MQEAEALGNEQQVPDRVEERNRALARGCGHGLALDGGEFVVREREEPDRRVTARLYGSGGAARPPFTAGRASTRAFSSSGHTTLQRSRE